MRGHWVAWLLAPLVTRSVVFSTSVAGGVVEVDPSQVCAEFEAGGFAGSVWTLADCMEVWAQFNSTIPIGLHRRSSMVDMWRDTALELRGVGSPCLMATAGKSDGVGSTTIRFIAAWVFSREMGCDWVTPSYGRKKVAGGNGTAVYCHGLSTQQEHQIFNKTVTREMTRCTTVNWEEYFQFGVPSVDQPVGKSINAIELDLRPEEHIAPVKSQLADLRITSSPWDHVMFKFSLSFAARHFVRTGCWDQTRLGIVRTVLQEARNNFHRHPRPWYEENPSCGYETSRVNFAIHVRMGDRRLTESSYDMYFKLLEQFMETATAVVVDKGLNPPLFHIFSETVSTCPSTKEGVFDEFPAWPVEVDQVRACLAAGTSEDCPEPGPGRSCRSTRSGVFNVRDKPIMLHLGSDVKNALTCMIHADGVLMGCSTFGQIAGILTKGIAFFSTACNEKRTPYQYRMVPPLAIAERGYLWVPILGSWHNPVLSSAELFRGALDTHLAAKHLTT